MPIQTGRVKRSGLACFVLVGKMHQIRKIYYLSVFYAANYEGLNVP